MSHEVTGHHLHRLHRSCALTFSTEKDVSAKAAVGETVLIVIRVSPLLVIVEILWIRCGAFTQVPETVVCGHCADATACCTLVCRESRAGECWEIGDVLATEHRKTLVPVYVGVAVVRAMSNTARALDLTRAHDQTA